jgi:hypothetical protein
MNNFINFKNRINMKTLKTLFLAVALIASYTLTAQVAVTTDGSSADGSAMLDVKSNDKGFLPPRMTQTQRDDITSPATGLIIYQTDGTAGLYQYNGTEWTPVSVTADGSETKLAAGTNVTITGAGTTASPYVVNATGGGSSNHFYLGQDTLGGIVFYIYIGSDGQQHGLVVSKTDTTAQWQNPTSTTNATRSWDGVYNMNLMTNSPAKNWITTNFSTDWYLPSIDELSILWHNRFHANKALNAGGFTLLSNTAGYWSSTEYATSAFNCNFHSGVTSSYGKASTYSVRAVRAF